MIVGVKTIAAFFALVVLAGGQMRADTFPDARGLSVAIIGDSYTSAGWGTTTGRSWQHYTALELGWSLDVVRAHPGGGYVNSGGGGPYEAALAANPLPATVQQVIVQGGFNDLASEPAQVGAAVSRTLALIHAQAPGATVTVVGTFDPGPGNFSDRYPGMRALGPAVQQAVEAAGDRYVDGFAVRFEVGPDRVHPTPAGHAQIGLAVAHAIRRAAPHTVGLRAGALNSRRAAVIGVSRVGAFGVRWFYFASTEGGRIGPVTRVAFGDAGDVPTLLPNAAGECMPAVYRPSAGTAYIASQPIDGGGHVEAIPFGEPGDRLVQNAPHAGPGGRSLFLHRPSWGMFFERVPGPGGPDVGALAFGDPGDRGVVYSVAGAGSTLGVHRPGNSTFYFANPSSVSAAPATWLSFGNPGDQGLVGAWGWSNVDGSDKVGVFRSREARWFLADTPTRLTGGPAAPITSVTSFHFGDPGDTALACDPE
ncbi:SGNH/GDSL hydrolase family protein [Geodermatophilus sp. YIM 151500]|uniref:SGNH/GDSL hydrolase family protein n=1 Tax=Geodermatophilus sp. YIM 151500 TaxID=2984531 RepID=UPI0021E47E3B|nr:SGNH/GDSL hydrolase family protein [Geodermatophilus sp. YIM 151500]MCV2488583.1 SGNH/GDSL hydrolase family protein [Geodermatophilus sp. YIM 151500]